MSETGFASAPIRRVLGRLWMANMLLYFMVSILGIKGVLPATFIKEPRDIAKLMGSNAKFDCKAADGKDILWLEYITNADGNTIYISKDNPNGVINPNHPNKGKYAIRDTDTLVVRNISMDDAGKYRCRLAEDENAFVDANLVTFRKTKCRDLIFAKENEKISLECEARFSGNRFPSVSWKSKNKILKSVSDDLPGQIIQIYTTKVSAKDDGKVYSCETYFKKPPPNFQNTCQTKVNVKYSTRQIKISPDAAVLKPGRAITCTAKGNPKPVITWKRIVDNEVVESITGDVIKTSDDRKGENVYVCVAENEVDGKKYSRSLKYEFIVVGGVTSSSNQLWIRENVQITAVLTLLVYIIS